jgi:uncharacterized protein with HEPN domain
MPADRQLGLLRDILDSAVAVRSYMHGVSREQFPANPEKQDAVLRRLEVIGEAASRLSPETRALFPGLPFRAMRGMRNVIAHDYGAVDVEQVWTTASGNMDELIAALAPHVRPES